MTRAAGLLEVIALSARDAHEAEAGGADRLEIVGTMDDDGLSPGPALVEELRRASSLPLRIMVRLRAGFGTDDAEIARLRRLARHYLDAGAEGLVLGFLTPAGDADVDAAMAVVGDLDCPWTFHRAIDHGAAPDRAWPQLLGLPGWTRSSPRAQRAASATVSRSSWNGPGAPAGTASWQAAACDHGTSPPWLRPVSVPSTSGAPYGRAARSPGRSTRHW
ncbi:copper homeostasis protein CutC [Salana multivorans]